MQLRPGAHSHRPVAGVLACVLRRGLRPGARVVALHLRPVTTRPAGGSGRTSEARIGEEAATSPQTDEDLTRSSLQSLLHLAGIVSSVEDEQRTGSLLLLLSSQEAHKRFHLLGGHLIGVLRRAEALYVHGGNPALADEIELCDELVGPARYDGLPGGVAGR